MAGESNIADYLSRYLKAKTYVPSQDIDSTYKINSVIMRTENRVNMLVRKRIQNDEIDIETISKATREDEELQRIKHHIITKNDQLPSSY